MTDRLLRNDLVQAGLVQYGEFITAGEEEANVKLEFNILKRGTELYGRVVGALVLKAVEFRPDVLISCPSGADELTVDMARKLDLPYVLPRKDSETGEIKIQAPMFTQATLLNKKRALLIDDAFTTGSTMRKVFAVPEFNDVVIGGLSIWDRSDPSEVRRMPFRTEAVIHEYVPLRQEQPA